MTYLPVARTFDCQEWCSLHFLECFGLRCSKLVTRRWQVLPYSLQVPEEPLEMIVRDRIWEVGLQEYSHESYCTLQYANKHFLHTRIVKLIVIFVDLNMYTTLPLFAEKTFCGSSDRLFSY